MRRLLLNSGAIAIVHFVMTIWLALNAISAGFADLDSEDGPSISGRVTAFAFRILAEPAFSLQHFLPTTWNAEWLVLTLNSLIWGFSLAPF